MILSFGDPATEDLFHGRNTARTRKFGPEMVKAARRKLDAIGAAADLSDLAALPGNRLEALLNGFLSIRVNNKWRIVFRWEKGGASEVKVTDYH